MTTAVITGVTKGLGRALAEEFIASGIVVAGCGRSATALKELSANSPESSFDKVDITDDASVKKWAAKIQDSIGPIDLLINNAGYINENNPLWEIGAKEMRQVLSVNIEGTTNLIRHFVPQMVHRRRGAIVNFSSTWGRSVSAEVAPYCASKWAIEGLTKALAEELPRGMAAVALNPGIIHTDMLESCFGEGAASYESPEEWAKRAAPYILKISPSDNGKSLAVPG
jgi:NAD(P)-dependent dehydrogenase (short-subunit alcohol dehydrogenase family)